MKVIIEKSTARGTAFAPPSKSMAHRMLICGALSEASEISNLSDSKDIHATISCLESMGGNVLFDGDKASVGGVVPQHVSSGAELFCDESGSTLRFMLPICMLSGNRVALTGSKRLFERPLSVYEEICREQSILMEKTDTSVTVCGKLRAGDYVVRGDISSQFISGLLFALPLADGDSTITVTGRFESASYIDLTLLALRNFGVEVKREHQVFYIRGNQTYQNRNIAVEGDYSNAAFLEALNLLGGEVEVLGLDQNSLQGDRVYNDMFRAMVDGEKQFDLSDCPDLAPVMFAMAAFLGGAEFTGTARLKIKESDRAAAMAEELSKFGIHTSVYENSVVVHKGALSKPTELLLGHNDHRIVMALSLLCSVTGGEIEGAEAVAKSYPDFFEQIRKLGVKIKKIQ